MGVVRTGAEYDDIILRGNLFHGAVNKRNEPEELAVDRSRKAQEKKKVGEGEGGGGVDCGEGSRCWAQIPDQSDGTTGQHWPLEELHKGYTPFRLEVSKSLADSNSVSTLLELVYIRD